MLLIDLDGTLLINPLDRFMPVYLKLLSSSIAHLLDPQEFLKHLLQATDKMIQNEEPNQTLKTAFDTDFYSHFLPYKTELESVLVDFYKNKYPLLKSYTSPIAEAIDLVNYAFDSGMQVVIATNPLFPMRAQLERLEWANLPADKYPFSFVTSYESFHFAKPNPAYFAEIMAHLGWPDEPVYMIGNSLTEDILPAIEMGIPGFLVSDANPAVLSLPEAVEFGTLLQARKWLSQTSNNTKFNSQKSIIARLIATTAVIDNALLQIASYPKSSLPSILKIMNQFLFWEREENANFLNHYQDSSELINEKDTSNDSELSDLESIDKAWKEFAHLRGEFVSFLRKQNDSFFIQDLTFSFNDCRTAKEVYSLVLGRDQSQLRLLSILIPNHLAKLQ